MPSITGASWPSTIFMGLSFFGILLGYWKILGQLSFANIVSAEPPGSARPFLNSSPEALNPQLTNTVENDTITLFYNGSGPVPAYDEESPLPQPISPLTDPSAIEEAIWKEFVSVVNGTALKDDCAKCIASFEIMHLAALTQPVQTITNLLVRACTDIPLLRTELWSETCESQYGGLGHMGPYYAQLFFKMSMATGDMHYLCTNNYHVCEETAPVEIEESLYFTPKPEAANIAPRPSGKTMNVLHLSDWHLDSRYDIGSEANCTDYMCCRPNSINTVLHTDSSNASWPASRFGAFDCDTPADLALSAFKSMHNFFDMDDISFSIFTGDIVSHDHHDQLSWAYVSYEEEQSYRVFKTMLGSSPLYATLGNHDTLPISFNPQHSLDPDPKNLSSNIMSWNYELVSSLWERYSWLNESEADTARSHYGAYAATTPQGLRIISLNSDFWYRANIFNYWNTTNPDQSGILKFLADELSACEQRGQRAWIIAHVLTGYDGEANLPNPTALFYAIVRRFSPATIAGVFFGHTHVDQMHLFYDFLPDSESLRTDTVTGQKYRDTLAVDFDKPLQVAMIGPSITPLVALNAGYVRYQIDAETFSVVGKQVYIANISESLTWEEPVWQFEYDAHEAYDERRDGKRDIEREVEVEGDITKDAIGELKTFKQHVIEQQQQQQQHRERTPHPRHEGDDDDDDHDENSSTNSKNKNKNKSLTPLDSAYYHSLTARMLHDPELLALYETYQSKSSVETRGRAGSTCNPGESVEDCAKRKVCYLRAGSTGLATRCDQVGSGARRLRKKGFRI